MAIKLSYSFCQVFMQQTFKVVDNWPFFAGYPQLFGCFGTLSHLICNFYKIKMWINPLKNVDKWITFEYKCKKTCINNQNS